MINKRLVAGALFFFVPLFTFALTDSHMAQDPAKFYVVLSVLGTILAGIFISLLYLERRITKLEQQSTKK